MDQNIHDNGAFQTDDQPHSSLSTVLYPDDAYSSETLPLLSERGSHEESIVTIQSPENPSNDFSEPNPRLNGAQTVTCRVCENQIPYENKTMQHVVRCPRCNEATPIRSAPTGKKFVRCPCDCLLICKVSSNRIACPRPNCNRVIILKPAISSEVTIPAPAGTARISCFYCQEVFIYNTIANHIVRCPHCRQKSSIGLTYTRSRTFYYFMIVLLAFLSELLLMLYTVGDFGSHPWIIIIYIILLIVMLVYSQKFATFVRLKTSQIMGPV